MLVLAMQFSRSSGRRLTPHPAHEDAGSTWWPCRRRLEWSWLVSHSLKTEDRTVAEIRGPSYDGPGTRPSECSNWESLLHCAGALTP